METNFNFLNSMFFFENMTKEEILFLKEKRQEMPSTEQIQRILFLFQNHFTPDFIRMNEVLYIDGDYCYDRSEDLSFIDLQQERKTTSTFNFFLNIHFKEKNEIKKINEFHSYFNVKNFKNDYLKLNINKKMSFVFKFEEFGEFVSKKTEIIKINKLIEVRLARGIFDDNIYEISFNFKRTNFLNRFALRFN